MTHGPAMPQGTIHAASGNSEQMGGPPISAIARHLKGATFPAAREGLVRQAQANGAGEDIVGVLQAIPDREFATLTEAMDAVGEVEHRGDGAER